MNMVNGAGEQSGGQYDYDFRFLRRATIFPDVRFGLKADMTLFNRDVRFTPE
jgi:hypothetical protein